MKPRFQHDCDGCTLFAQDSADWYICGRDSDTDGLRTIVRRFADPTASYASSTIGECRTMSRLELGAVHRGLQLTEAEANVLLKRYFDDQFDKLGAQGHTRLLGTDEPLDEPCWRAPDFKAFRPAAMKRVTALLAMLSHTMTLPSLIESVQSTEAEATEFLRRHYLTTLPRLQELAVRILS